MLQEIRSQLVRLHSRTLEAETIAGDATQLRIKVTRGARSCVVEAAGFLAMLTALPNAAGTRVIVKHIGQRAQLGERWAGS
jgi:23S rRNA A2030 N6-methylase RlmJ